MTYGYSIPKLTIGHNASGAMTASEAASWHTLDWKQATLIVKSLQARIVKAVKAGKWKRVRDLQRLLSRCTSAKAIAVRRVTENKGKRTAGMDGEKWDSPLKKYQAIGELKQQGYKAQSVRRILIPKSNGKMRPLGIPTMKDRAMQALHLLGLQPVSETLADSHSHGFRPYRSTADAIKRCHHLLSKKTSATWILEADIKGCFDHISHDWLLEHIPMNKRVLHQWLKSGYFEKQAYFPTRKGTPQGSIISPTLANMVLDGLEQKINQALKIKSLYKDGKYHNPYKVYLIRYADDFIITANQKEVLEQQIMPIIESFLENRGLELSKEKTAITSIDEGFDFLGKNIRKYKRKLIIKPSKKNVLNFLKKIKATIKKNATAKTEDLIDTLNPMIRGWANYHKMDNAKATFSYVDSRIFEMTWQWAVRRHDNKGKKWISKHYFTSLKNRKWIFFAKDRDEKVHHIFKASSIPIKRHIPIRSTVNPYAKEDELYFERRNDQIMLDKVKGKRRLEILYRKQKGCCGVCQQKITRESGWNLHHIHPIYLGGKDTLDNLVLLHPVCHVQVHQNPNSELNSS